MRTTIYCSRCTTRRRIEQWCEEEPDVLSVVLGPCGHVIRCWASLEWSTSPAPRGERPSE